MTNPDSPAFPGFFSTDARKTLQLREANQKHVEDFLDVHLDQIELFEFRHGSSSGPRVWLFDWQIQLLRHGELGADYEQQTANYLAAAFIPGFEWFSKNLKPEERSSYQAMWLLYRARIFPQEYRGSRKLDHILDLTVSRSGAIDENSVLPGVSGGPPLKEFWTSGERAAGIPHGAKSADILPHALYERIKQQAKETFAAETLWQIVMGSVIGTRQHGGGNTDALVKRDEMAEALEHPFVPRLLAWLEKHNAEELTEYWRHFGKQVSDSFKDLATQKKDAVTRKRWPDDGLDKDECRRVFICLVMFSYQYVSQCCESFCRAIRAGINPPLSKEEGILFDRMHMARPSLAGLVPVVLTERLRLLRPALRDLWSLSPCVDDSTVDSRLAMMLRDYRILITFRRDADRSRKAKHGNITSQLSEYELDGIAGREEANEGFNEDYPQQSGDDDDADSSDGTDCW